MSRNPRILLVTNSVPLPDTDFLKYKIFGLSQVFDLHVICWDSDANRKAFYNKYSNKLKSKNIHLFYNKLNTITILKLLLINFLRVLFTPLISIPLTNKLIMEYGWNIKKLFVKFTVYYPILSIKPDIVHFEYGTLAHQFSDIKKFVPCKTSVSFRGYDLNYVGLEDANYYHKVWKNFDGFHFLGNDLKKRAIKRGYHSCKTEILIPPGIDTTFFVPNEHKMPNDKLMIISVGRLAWKKGYEYGLQAVAKLKHDNVPFEYKIIADGNYQQPVRFTISELGLENEVQLLGGKNPDEIRTALSKADVFFHPAISEGFSNAVLEAQAMGLPVVTTGADGLSENVQDGVTGFVVQVYDVSAMADKLAWCYHNKEQLSSIGKSGMDRVRAHFRIEDQVKKFEGFYKELNEG